MKTTIRLLLFVPSGATETEGLIVVEGAAPVATG